MCFAPQRRALFRVHFDLEMCFAPQRRPLFRHLNFQKWSEPGVFCTFWLGNLLRATTACNFSSLIWPAGSAPAALASLLFDPLEPQIIGKTQCFATFLPFRASASAFFWFFLLSDLLSSNLSLLSASALLCVSFVHIVGSLTSKLPSTIVVSFFPSLSFSNMQKMCPRARKGADWRSDAARRPLVRRTTDEEEEHLKRRKRMAQACMGWGL